MGVYLSSSVFMHCLVRISLCKYHTLSFVVTLKINPGKFPGGPVVRALRFHCRVWVQSLVWELGFQHAAAKKKKKERKRILASSRISPPVFFLHDYLRPCLLLP